MLLLSILLEAKVVKAWVVVVQAIVFVVPTGGISCWSKICCHVCCGSRKCCCRHRPSCKQGFLSLVLLSSRRKQTRSTCHDVTWPGQRKARKMTSFAKTSYVPTYWTTSPRRRQPVHFLTLAISISHSLSPTQTQCLLGKVSGVNNVKIFSIKEPSHLQLCKGLTSYRFYQLFTGLLNLLIALNEAFIVHQLFWSVWM